MNIGPQSNGYKYFSMQTVKYDDGDSHLLYYTNKGFDGGQTFCHVKGNKIMVGDDWCFLIEDHIIYLCKILITHKPYDFYEHFRLVIREKALSDLGI